MPAYTVLRRTNLRSSRNASGVDVPGRFVTVQFEADTGESEVQTYFVPQASNDTSTIRVAARNFHDEIAARRTPPAAPTPEARVRF